VLIVLFICLSWIEITGSKQNKTKSLSKTHVFVCPLGEHVHTESPSTAHPASESKDPPKVLRVCGLQTGLQMLIDFMCMYRFNSTWGNQCYI